MKRNISLTTILILLYKLCCSQTTFQKSYSGTVTPGSSSEVSAIQNFDGGYTISSTGLYNNLTRTNSFGDTLWSKSYNYNYLDGVSDFKKTNDGGYILLSATNNSATSNRKILLFKTDSLGNILFSKNYGTNGMFLSNWGNSVKQTSDGGYIIGGMTQRPGGVGYSLYIIKSDSTGSLEWTRTLYCGTWYQYTSIVSITQTNDGNFVVSSTMNFPSYKIVLMKFQNNGNLLWSKNYSAISSTTDIQYDFKVCNDGGFIILGQNSYNSLYLVKTDSTGLVSWSKTYLNGGYASPCKIYQTYNNEFIIAGDYFDGSSPGHTFLLKTDVNGNYSWSKTYGTYYVYSRNVIQTSDEGYAISGYSSGFGTTPAGFFMIKTDSLGNSGCNEINRTDSTIIIPSITVSNFTPIISSLNSISNITMSVLSFNSIITNSCPFTGINETIEEEVFSIYPNPFISSTTISFSKDQKNALIKVIDILGKEIKKINFTGNQLTIEKGDLTKGVYFVQVIDENKNVVTKKILIQ